MSLGVGYDVKGISGGAGTDVNIAQVGGIAIGATVPVSGLVDTSNAKTITGALGALNDTIVFPCGGLGEVTFKLDIAGTLDAIVLFEASNDGGITYSNTVFALDGNQIGYPATVTSGGSSTSAAVLSVSYLYFNGAAFTHIRAKVIVYNSGTSNGIFYGTSASANFVLPLAQISAGWTRITDEVGTNAWDITGGAGLVRATSLPLPTGAATAARQDTGNTSLASIDTKLTSPLTVQAVDLDIRNLLFATDKVDVSGSLITASPVAQVTAGPTLLNGAGQSILLALASNIGADFTLVFAAYTGQIRGFVSFDNGATYVTTIFADARNGTFYPPTTIAYVAETSTQDLTIFIPAGATHVKLDLPTYTSGSVTVTIRGNNIQFIPNYGKGFAGDIRNIQWGQQIGGTPAPSGTWLNATVTDVGPVFNAAGLVVRNLSSQASITEGPNLSTDGLATGIATYEATNGLIAVIHSRKDAPGGADVGVITRNIPSGTQPVSGTINTKTDLTPSAPTAASVGVASALALAANANRKGLKLINTSNARISLGFGSAAVLDSGVTLFPGGVLNMDEYDFDLGTVNAIASVAASNLAIQEYTT